MIWMWTKGSHISAISPRTRAWLRSSFLDRFFLILSAPSAWVCWGIALLLLVALESDGETVFLAVSSIPFAFWIIDAVLDRIITAGEIDRLLRDGVVLATRAEYVGGHPRLPHGRFAYLALAGTRQNPLLRLIFPGSPPAPSTQMGSTPPARRDETFDMPLLDLDKTAEKREPTTSLTLAFLASLTEKPGKRQSEDRVTLNVDYHGPGGRKHRVELTSFFNGPDEIRNWRNYLVCAQFQADTGETPFGPWVTLKDEPPKEATSDDATGDGSKVQPARRAFERR